MFTTHFFGNKISDYGKENKRVDYATLAKSFDAVMCNDLMEKTANIGYWDLVSGYDYHYDVDGEYFTPPARDDRIEELENNIEALENELTEDEQEKNEELQEMRTELEDLENACEIYADVFQWFIISEHGASILQEYTDEIVYYNEELNIYLWGVTHYGTSWDYVLTDIECTGI